MGNFWAGLLVGLCIWVAAESLLRFRRPVSKRLREHIFAVAELRGDTDDLEYLLRRLRADLAGCGFGNCTILLADSGLSPEQREIAVRMDGVRLCTEKELAVLP